MGCRAVLDAHGEVAELHVVSTGVRPPKLIIRDIQSVLMVRLNLSIPYRKISVAALEEPSQAGRAAQVKEKVTVSYAAAPAEEMAAEEGPEPHPGLPLVLGEVSVGYVGSQLRVRVELTSGGRRLSASVSGSDEGIMPALLGARAVMDALAGEPAWRGVHLQWVDVAGVSAAPAVVVSVVRSQEPERGRVGPPVRECVGVRPERGNLTLAAAAATVEALIKLLSEGEAAL